MVSSHSSFCLPFLRVLPSHSCCSPPPPPLRPLGSALLSWRERLLLLSTTPLPSLQAYQPCEMPPSQTNHVPILCCPQVSALLVPPIHSGLPLDRRHTSLSFFSSLILALVSCGLAFFPSYPRSFTQWEALAGTWLSKPMNLLLTPLLGSEAAPDAIQASLRSLPPNGFPVSQDFPTYPHISPAAFSSTPFLPALLFRQTLFPRMCSQRLIEQNFTSPQGFFDRQHDFRPGA